MEFLVIGMKGSRYSQSPILVRVWDPESRIVVQLLILFVSLDHPSPLRDASGPNAHGLADVGLPT
jgi:hypothetical protein